MPVDPFNAIVESMLPRMRAVVEGSLNGTCQILRQDENQEYQPVGKPVPCRVLKEIKQPGTTSREGVIEFVAHYPIQFRWKEDVRVNDQLVVNDKFTYRVIGTNASKSQRADLQAKGVLVQ